MQLFDGQEYPDNATLPDLGSIQCISTTGGGIREYRGLSKDFDKLKAYVQKVNLLTGCFILFEDTGETYEYFALDRSWNHVPRSGSVNNPETPGEIDDVTDDPDINFDDEWNG